MYRYKRITSIILTTGVVIVTMGFGCGEAWQPSGTKNLPKDHYNLTPSPQDAGDNGDLIVVPGEKTVSVAYFEQVYFNLMSITSFEYGEPKYFKLSYDQNRDIISETGSVNDMNPATYLGMITINAKMCWNVVDRERNLPAEDRVIFGRIVDKQNLDQMSDDDLLDATNRLARTFWQRNETAAEREIVLTKMAEFRAQRTVGAPLAALFLCSAMVSSYSGLEM